MRLAGTFTVDPAHPSLPGHFPGRPIAPGVLLIDEASALILAGRPGELLAGLPEARFLRPVHPGDEVSVSYADDGGFACAVRGETVLRGRMVFA